VVSHFLPQGRLLMLKVDERDAEAVVCQNAKTRARETYIGDDAAIWSLGICKIYEKSHFALLIFDEKLLLLQLILHLVISPF